jgi:uncharacterized zinc-type alcohol dehydrogenase-like protein
MKIGKVTAVGSAVSKFKVGEIAGVGCFVDSCRTCKSCKAGDEQLCDEGMTGTYNSYERGTKTRSAYQDREHNNTEN